MTPAPGWVEVDLDAIEHNLDTVLRRIDDTADVCAVVKADAYGHGIEHVLPLVIARGIGTIGITSTDEAVAARFLGYTGRILRIRPALAEEVEEGIAHGVEEWIGGADHAEVVARVAAARGIRIRAHVSINATGITRDGIELAAPGGPDEMGRVLARRELEIVGVCSHFPCEDRADVAHGAAAFQVQAAAALRAMPAGRDAVRRHCATSFAALTVPESRFDLVRIGAALYGDTAAPDPALRPAFTLKSRVAAVNRYPAGRTVGYERTHRLERDALLASVPIGYADGVQRSLGGRASVLIRGRRVPIVDRHAMNTLTVDATSLGHVEPGDEVVFYGSQGDERISSADLEHANGHIAADLYSVWGRLHPRVPVRTAARAL
ncbi:alanine racemase [Agromyces aurantiacus]|uniref:Alanine racemase n=1 Tax=Agromyces aurantiacus TaxID=165814 RepID=A0ABV9R6S1_9MICO|nr:alanine racemase [Agromyces aurantiacus]MBM7503662.1 alanine racemase [Agromyces aurantiacus]